MEPPFLDTPARSPNNALSEGYGMATKRISLGCLLLLWTGVVGACGEFHTNRFYTPDDVTADQTADNMGPICDDPRLLVPQPVHPLSLILGEPVVVALQTQDAVQAVWRISEGVLPEGITLLPGDGLLVGVPQVVVATEVLVEALPATSGDVCLLPGTTPVSVVVTPGCLADADCAVPEGSNLVGRCREGRCRGQSQRCPGMGQDRARLEIPGAVCSGKTPCSLPAAGRVFSHSRLMGGERERKSDATHKLVLETQEGITEIRYALPDAWTLPLRHGEEISWGYAVMGEGRQLTIRKDAEWLAMVLDGPPHLQDPSAPLHLSLIPSSCPGIGSQCGQILSSWVVDDANHEFCPILEAPGECAPSRPPFLTVYLATAYQYETLESERCPGVLPSWLSVWAGRNDVCPVARITTNSPGTAFLSGAFTAPPPLYFIGAESRTGDGVAIQRWNWSLEQPFPGFVSLVAKGGGTNGGPGPLSLSAAACGRYVVQLEVTDQSLRTSCIPDLFEVGVRPDPDLDLRMELVWTDEKSTYRDRDNLDLMLVYPLFSSGTMDAMDPWVCSQANPQPIEWMLGDPSRKDEICQCARGWMEIALPEVITVKRLNRKMQQPFDVVVRADTTNHAVALASLRVYLRGTLAFQRLGVPLEPGDVWSPGQIFSGTGTFVGR